MAQFWGPALWIDVLTAIGTIGAAVTAARIALADRTRRRRGGLEHARLSAAAMGMRAMRIRESAKLMVPWLEFVSTSDGDPGKSPSMASSLKEVATISLDELPPLIALKNSCAFNLAAGLDQLDMGRKMLEHFTSTNDKLDHAARNACAKECLPTMKKAHELLNLACTELEKVAPIKK